MDGNFVAKKYIQVPLSPLKIGWYRRIAIQAGWVHDVEANYKGVRPEGSCLHGPETEATAQVENTPGLVLVKVEERW